MNDSIPGGVDRSRREAWSRYWARGVPHSCIGTYGDRYGGAIAAFWKDVFAGLADGARVLDIATGNGALPRLLLDCCREPGVTCDAVDIATVHLPWLASVTPAERQRVRLHGGVDAGALPFAGATFDVAVSQYGLEYTDLERSVPELLRVLSPRGEVAMVLHHGQGRPATLAAVEIGHIRWLTAQGGWFDATAAMIEPMARAASFGGRASLQGDARANAARERFNAVQNELSARAAGQNELSARAAGQDGADVLFDMREAAMSVFAMAGREGATVAGNALAAMRQELMAGATRLEDLRCHAFGTEGAQALVRRLESGLGREVALGELREQGGHLMGWTLRSLPGR
ncbi:MAG TPA: class I SAM-dependent methyltransferase [Croceibacterium sp.]|nr:class I SAM-dependent methyltransferase [Croceibacterium sp.]